MVRNYEYKGALLRSPRNTVGLQRFLGFCFRKGRYIIYDVRYEQYLSDPTYIQIQLAKRLMNWNSYVTRGLVLLVKDPHNY